ncbi:MAG: PAS domain S-box protein [Deltaproteobacteria bacterium]|nr:MAG: PAS domain S-box protein [Deltaproteobacteria bacterium]
MRMRVPASPAWCGSPPTMPGSSSSGRCSGAPSTRRSPSTLIAVALLTLLAFARADSLARRRAADETRLSDERFRLLLGAVRDYAIIMLDPQGRVESWNGAAERIFGYTAPEIVGQHVSRFLPAGMAPDAELVAAERERFEEEALRVRKSGETFWADVVVTGIRDREGKLRGFAKVVRDVTERKLLDDELRENRARLAQSNRELQDFAMVASHDLQEPLRKVQMFGDKLRRRYAAELGDEGRDWLLRMTNAATRGQSLIQGLLAFSRVTTKAQPKISVDLEQTTREVVGDLEARIADAGGRVEIGALPTVQADPLQMRQLRAWVSPSAARSSSATAATSLRRASLGVAPPSLSISPQASEETMTPKPLTILMADDDEDDRMSTREAFQEHHLVNDFHTVNDGEELMEFLHRRGKYKSAPRPGLILLDLNMPRKDGREALREIKSDPQLRSIPVVILTTSREEEDILKTYDLGANSFVAKPVGFESLVQLVSTMTRYWFQLVELPPQEAMHG